MSTKTKHPLKLTFDGCGINGPDEHKTRLCTFDVGIWGNPIVKELGPLFASSPKLKQDRDELLNVAIWHRDALDLGDIEFFDKHGFNVSEIFPRTRQAIANATAP